MTGTEMADYLAQIGSEHNLPPEWYDSARRLMPKLYLSDDPEWRITIEDCIAYKKINAVDSGGIKKSITNYCRL